MMAVSFRLDELSTTTQHIVGHGRRSSLGGWGIENCIDEFDAEPAIRAYVVQANGSVVVSHTHKWSGSGLGYIHVAMLKVIGTNFQFFIDGCKVGADVTITSYKTPDAALSTSVGACDDGSSPCSTYTITGLVGSNATAFSTVQEVGHISTGYTKLIFDQAQMYPVDFEDQADPLPSVVSTSYRWIGSELDGLPVNWSDEVSGLILEKQGDGGLQANFFSASLGQKSYYLYGGWSESGPSRYYKSGDFTVSPIPGSTAMTVGVLCMFTSSSFSDQGFVFSTVDSGSPDSGWGIFTFSSSGLEFFVIDGSGTMVFATTSVQASDVNKFMLLTCTYDGTNARIYKDSTLATTSSAGSGYIAPSSVLSTIGANPSAGGGNGEPYILDVFAADGVLSGTGVLDWYSQLSRNHVWVEPPGVTMQAHWSLNYSSVVTPITDDVSGKIITKSGNPLITQTVPYWRS